MQAIDSREVLPSHFLVKNKSDFQENFIPFSVKFCLEVKLIGQKSKLGALKGKAASFVKNQTGTFNDMLLLKSRFGFVCSGIIVHI